MYASHAQAAVYGLELTAAGTKIIHEFTFYNTLILSLQLYCETHFYFFFLPMSIVINSSSSKFHVHVEYWENRRQHASAFSSNVVC